MDPITIIGVVSSVISIGEVVVKSIKKLSDLKSRFRNVPRVLPTLIGQLYIIKAALDRLSACSHNILTKDPRYQELAMQIDVSLASFGPLLTSLQQHLDEFDISSFNASDLTTMSKVSFLWNEQEMTVYLDLIDRQIMAEEDNQTILQMARDCTSSIIGLTDGGSIFSEDTTALSTIFDFDTVLLGSRAYQAAQRSHLKRVVRSDKEAEISPEAENSLDPFAKSQITTDHVEIVGSTDYTALSTDKTSRQAFKSATDDELYELSAVTQPRPTADNYGNIVVDRIVELNDWPLASEAPSERAIGSVSERPADTRTFSQFILPFESATDDDFDAVSSESQSRARAASHSNTFFESTIGVYSMDGTPARTVTERAVRSTAEKTKGTKTLASIRERRAARERQAVREAAEIAAAHRIALEETERSNDWKKTQKSLQFRLQSYLRQSSKPDRQTQRKSFHKIESLIPKRREDEVKLLILGTSESGKSTLLKLVKLHLEGDYKLDEKVSFSEIILSNTVQGIRVILEAMENLEIALEDQRNEYHVQTIFMQPYQIEGDTLPPDVGDAVRTLWQDAGCQESYRRRFEYQLNDSLKYYAGDIERMSASDYIPNSLDVVRSRVKTTGITETTFEVDKIIYRIFDVEGTRSGRKKWIHCFEHASIITCTVDAAAYCRLLFEDETVNRMEEQLTLWDSIANSRWFVNTDFILIFTKIDQLQECLNEHPVKKYFPDFDSTRAGEDLLQDYMDYLEFRFSSILQDNQQNSKDRYSQVRFVWADLVDVENNFAKSFFHMTEELRTQRKIGANILFNRRDLRLDCAEKWELRITEAMDEKLVD